MEKSPSNFAQKIENFLFHKRIAILSVISVLFVFLTIQAVQVKPEASFTKMIPGQHEFINNFLTYRKELAGLGNVVRVVVENTDGDIFEPEFQEILKQVTDEVFFIPGVNRNELK
jgi:predicted RND superfamily exporter protein